MPIKKTIYHVGGREMTCNAVTARENVTAWPEHWAYKPWPETKPAPVPATAQATGKAEGGTEDKQPPTQPSSEVPPEAPGKVVVPPDWESLTFFAKQEIAQQIIGKQDRTLKKEQVEQIIRDYRAK